MPTITAAADHVPEILASGPIGLEGFDKGLVEDMLRKGLHPSDAHLLPGGGGWLLVEFGGENKQESDEKAHRLMAELQKKGNAPTMKLFDKAEEAAKIWQVRESGLASTAFVPGKKTAVDGMGRLGCAPG